MRLRFALVLLFAVGCKHRGCGSAAETKPPATFQLPGATEATVDLSAYDRTRNRVWIPVAETGSVDVFDIAAGSFARVDGFKTLEREARGHKHILGPSSVAIGEGFAYVGDRASNEVCAVDGATLKMGACVSLNAPPDVIAYVGVGKEVWVTTPKRETIVVIDAVQADAPKSKIVIKTEGAAECFAIDSTRGIFYTNLEDKNRTLAIDISAHAIKSTWALGCKDDGPRGIAVDVARNFVFVACKEKIEVLDGAKDGARIAEIDAGSGIDEIEWVEASKRLYVAGGKSATLTVLQFSDKGAPSVVSTSPTAAGARNPVVDADGNAYVVDPATAKLLVIANH